jgi:hypothetical protein
LNFGISSGEQPIQRCNDIFMLDRAVADVATNAEMAAQQQPNILDL